MKGLIIYKGKYGATKQYAQWLSEGTDFPCIDADKFDEATLSEFDTIIIGTSVYIGKLKIGKWLKRNWHELRDKKVYLFLVAGTPPSEKEKLTAYVRSNVPNELFNQLSLTFLPGKLIRSELSSWDRFLLKMGSKLAEKKDPAQKIAVDYNHVDRDYLKPLFLQLRLPASVIR